MRRQVAARFMRSITRARQETGEDNRRFEPGHQRALLTLDFLIQPKARSRDGGGACQESRGPVPERQKILSTVPQTRKLFR